MTMGAPVLRLRCPCGGESAGCPNCGGSGVIETPDPAQGGPTIVPFQLTDVEVAALAATLPELARWYRTSRRKHAFATQVGTTPAQLPFQDDVVWAMIQPQGAINVGGISDGAQMTTGVGANQGWPLGNGQVMTFGPEDASQTWAVAASNTWINCFEGLP